MFIHLFLFLEPYKGIAWKIDENLANSFGTFIGGYIGTIFILFSFVLLYATLKNQRQSFEIQQFESKFFQLIKLHRDNVNEMTIIDKKGRKVFLSLVREFREGFKIIKKVAQEINQKYEEEELINIAYLAFYYGAVGEISSEVLRNVLINESDQFVDKLINTFKEKQKDIESHFDYEPFEGHQSRLGHYFCHLYQTVKYVDAQKINIEKYEYIKILIAQLSIHEQVLFCFNILSKLGRNWKDEKLITKYRMIKNIPQSFITEFDLKAKFPDLLFEWEENII